MNENLATFSDFLFIIPIRTGSKRILNKNFRDLGGKALFLHTLEACSEITNNIVLDTDNPSKFKPFIRHVKNYILHKRINALGDDIATIDEVVYSYLKLNPCPFKYIITVQTTSPFISSQTIKNAIFRFLRNPSKTLVTCSEKKHLFYKKSANKYKPFYKKRLNSQQLEPLLFETGGIVICSIEKVLKYETRFHGEIEPFTLKGKEALDIDTPADFYLAKYYITGTRLLLVLKASKKVGSGHFYRCIQIMQELPEYQVTFFMLDADRQFVDLIRKTNAAFVCGKTTKDILDYCSKEPIEHVILDVLDTEHTFIEKLRLQASGKIITLEDLGTGSIVSDLTINELYNTHCNIPHILNGYEYAFLRNEFLAEVTHKKTINFLITFGGTDPSGYTIKFLSLLNKIYTGKKIVVLLGIGSLYLYKKVRDIRIQNKRNKICVVHNSKNVSKVMQHSQIAFTANGRTVYELLSQKVQIAVKPQNPKELMHMYSNSSSGIYNFGLKNTITIGEVKKAVSFLNLCKHKPSINIDFLLSKSKFLQSIRNCLRP